MPLEYIEHRAGRAHTIPRIRPFGCRSRPHSEEPHIARHSALQASHVAKYDKFTLYDESWAALWCTMKLIPDPNHPTGVGEPSANTDAA